MVVDSGPDDPEPVVHPTEDDPIVAALSRSVGGPVGDHAGHHPWWTPVRVVLAMVAIVCALGFVQKAPCYHTKWTNQQAEYSDLCYSDLPYLYVGRGFAELGVAVLRLDQRARPLQRDGVPRRDRLLRLGYGVGDALAVGVSEPRPSGRLLAGPAVPRPPDTPGDDAVRRGDRDRVRALRAARGVVPDRRTPASPVGRRTLRGLAGAAVRGPDQLGPAGGGLCRGSAVGPRPRASGPDRGHDRPRHGDEALPALPARRSLPGVGPRAPLARPRGGDC